MTQLPEVLTPASGDRGVATVDRARLAASISQSWALFEALVDDVDLDGPTRARGLTAREIVIPLGAWDDNRPLADLVADARDGVVGDHDQGALVDAVRAAHLHESDDAIRDAIRRQSEQMSTWLYGDEVDEMGTAPVASMLGTLPLLTFLHAATYPLATSALDLEPAGATAPEVLLDNGLTGLVDTIGALAARQGLTASICAVTPTITVGTGATGGAWTVGWFDAVSDLSTELGPSVQGPSRLILDVTAGRADVPAAIRGRQLAVHDVAGLLALAPLVEQVPGIPGRAALVGAIRATTALSSLVRRLPFGRGSA